MKYLLLLLFNETWDAQKVAETCFSAWGLVYFVGLFILFILNGLPFTITRVKTKRKVQLLWTFSLGRITVIC